MARGKWKEADAETGLILRRLAGKSSSGLLGSSDIEKLPCEELRAIDCLWTQHSQGRFGFSVQTQIYVSVGCDYGNFCDRIGWQHHNSADPSSLKFNTKAPMGHLPSRLWTGGTQWWKHAGAIALKLSQCSTQRDSSPN